MRASWITGLVAVGLLIGCDDGGGSDAGPFDAGPQATDAGPGGADAGPGDTDAGPGDADAGPGNTDAGPGGSDAGPGAVDGGMDAGPGSADAGPGGMDAGPGGMDAGPGGMDAGPGGMDAGAPDAGPSTDAGAGGCAITGALTLGVANTGTTAGAMNSYISTCGSTGGVDHAHTFTAAAAGLYNFRTEGSMFDTTLSVLAGTGCAGAELACNDDDAYGLQSQVAVSLTAGQMVTAIVDGYDSAESGAYLIEATADTCPAATDLMSAVGTNVGGGAAGTIHFRDGSCATTIGGELYFRWTAPMGRMYRFDTVGSTNDTVLYLLDGGCSGAELGCNDDTMGLASEVTATLTMGQVVIIVVDTYDAGTAQLNITML